jgi:hypothetical protein
MCGAVQAVPTAQRRQLDARSLCCSSGWPTQSFRGWSKTKRTFPPPPRGPLRCPRMSDRRKKFPKNPHKTQVRRECRQLWGKTTLQSGTNSAILAAFRSTTSMPSTRYQRLKEVRAKRPIASSVRAKTVSRNYTSRKLRHPDEAARPVIPPVKSTIRTRSRSAKENITPERFAGRSSQQWTRRPRELCRWCCGHSSSSQRVEGRAHSSTNRRPSPFRLSLFVSRERITD